MIKKGEVAMAFAGTPEGERPVEACVAEPLDHFGYAGAHFAGRRSVFEEDVADRIVSEIVLVTKSGGGVRAVDMPFWISLQLDPALKIKVRASGHQRRRGQPANPAPYRRQSHENWSVLPDSGSQALDCIQ
jgi:hypothetical protein